VANLAAIRTALAAQIAAGTGLRAEAQPRDQVSPPVALILPGSPAITYGATLSGGGETEVAVNLAVLLLISDAAPTEMVQRALDAYLGLGPGEEQSIAADPSLGGTAEWCIPVSVTSYSRLEYSGVNYFGARLSVQAGAS
jgi:hypothetical protein